MSKIVDDSSEGDDDECVNEETDIYNSSDDDNYNIIDEDYMNNITKLLETKSEVNYTNCLALNKEIQRSLIIAGQQLENLLYHINNRIKDISERLSSNLNRKYGGRGIRGAYLQGGTFYLRGNMFFKDANCRNAPNNSDYIYRSNEQNEMFPMDFELRAKHVWSVIDKVAIVQAVKEQIISYLRDQSAQKLLSSRRRTKVDTQLKDKVEKHTQTLVQLLKTVDNNFTIDWKEISAHNLRYRHSESSCKAMWDVYLKPSLRRCVWTDDENMRLIDAVKSYDFQNWKAIANKVGKRSDYQCFVQYCTCAFQFENNQNVKWTMEMDEKLLQAVEGNTENGIIKWNLVFSQFPQKSRTTLQQRYFNTLNPRISHAQFTPEEDLVLLAAVEEYGTKFSSIPRLLFPNRSCVQLRSRYRNILQYRHSQTAWSKEDDKKLMDFVSEYGPSEWIKCSEVLGNHNRISCRTRFLTIQKFFEQNPRATLDDLPRRKVARMSNTISTKNWIQKIEELKENPDTDLKPKRPKCGGRKAKIKNDHDDDDDDTAKPNTNNNKNINLKLNKSPRIASNVIISEVINQKQQRNKNKNKRLRSDDEDTSPEKRQKLDNVEIKGTSDELTTVIALLNERSNSSPNDDLYINTLRPVGVNFYDYFKYSYNFRLNYKIKLPVKSDTLISIANLLDFYPTKPTHKYKLDKHLPKTIAQNYRGCFLRKRNNNSQLLNYVLSPSWSTMMATRCLEIQSECDSEKVLTDADFKKLEKHKAIALFRKRLYALLAKTVMLSSLDADDYELFPSNFQTKSDVN